MLPASFIRENREFVLDRLKIKNFHQTGIIDDIIHLDTERRKFQLKQDNLQAELNLKSREIGTLFKEGKKDEADKARATTASLKEEIRLLNLSQTEVNGKLQDLLVQVPNLPHESVPAGKIKSRLTHVKSSGLH